MTLVGIVVAMFSVLHAVQCSKCFMNETKVPRTFKMEPAEHYPFTESALQIYTELRVPCDGFLKEWRFLAGNPFIYALHLGVFRKRTSKPRLVFELVAESHLSAMSTPEGLSGIWVYYPPEEPMPVKQGDLFGVFYDRYAISNEMLTISNKNDVNIGKAYQTETYVMLLDNLYFRQNRTVDATTAAIAYRKPALGAVITSFVPDAETGLKGDIDEAPKRSFRKNRKGNEGRRRRKTSTTPRMTTTTRASTTSTTSPATTFESLFPEQYKDEDIICNGFLCWPFLDYL